MNVTVRELRANLKLALDTAESGETVEIDRNGVQFFLIKDARTVKKDVNQLPLPLEKIEEPKLSSYLPRDKAIIAEIGELDKLIAMNRDVNQDPEWWSEIESKKKALWKEWHDVTGQ